MTLGYVQREMNLLKERVRILEEAKPDKAFKRLLIWTILAACAGSAVIVILGRTL